MLKYLKNNGFPVDLDFETLPHEDPENDFHGWKSKIFVDGKYYKDFIHSEYRDRDKWANGFFAAYEWEATAKYKWRCKEDPLRESGDLDVQVGDWIVDKEGYVRRVDKDSDPDMPYESIQRHATEKEVENNKLINNLLDELSDLIESNKFSWDIYGSELCAGDMIGKEKALECKINELRNVSKAQI